MENRSGLAEMTAAKKGVESMIMGDDLTMLTIAEARRIVTVERGTEVVTKIEIEIEIEVNVRDTRSETDLGRKSFSMSLVGIRG